MKTINFLGTLALSSLSVASGFSHFLFEESHAKTGVGFNVGAGLLSIVMAGPNYIRKQYNYLSFKNNVNRNFEKKFYNILGKYNSKTDDYKYYLKTKYFKDKKSQNTRNTVEGKWCITKYGKCK